MKNIIIIMVAAVTLVACDVGERHFLNDAAYRAQVHSQFEKRVGQMAGRKAALLNVLDSGALTLEEREAMEFLYAYMPLSDLADCDGEFFLGQVRAAFAARDYFRWGRQVPEEIFRHFVLVYRVNNEHLDTARQTFYALLKDRVANLSMREAALEVNHWCHERVTYRGTDGRTSSPLALVKTSWGRCGEESTFAAAALRAVGIPARQCYTPRWAHTDDNHAWVEVWVDGKWMYLGACEPEYDLNMAWFSAPSKRAMMVHTNVFGKYDGGEEKNVENALYSRINLLENYAAVRRCSVQITNLDGLPEPKVRVQFKVYNYAEFYAVAEALTDSNGYASIITGLGDVLIWANKGDSYGYAVSAADNEMAKIKLSRTPGTIYAETLVINVPSEQNVPPADAGKAAANAIRLAREDSIRNGYMATFISEDDARGFAAGSGLDGDRVWKYLQLAQGNWRDIMAVMENRKKDGRLFSFLGALTEKDLRDGGAGVLLSYLNGSGSVDADVYSPRIEREMIAPYTAYDLGGAKSGREIAEYVKRHVSLSDENYYNCRISPRGVYELRLSDKASRNIFFVAAARSAGVAARINKVTGKPQYYEKEWVDAVFDVEDEVKKAAKGKLSVVNYAGNIVKPGYYSHYTLAKYGDGDFRTLDYEGNAAVKNFPYTLDLEEGYYRLTTGSRANDGSVTAQVEYFVVAAGKAQRVEVRLPEVEGKLFVKGIVDMNTIVALGDGSKASLKELSRGKGLVVCFADLGKEPSKHILQDLPAVQKELDAWGGGVLVVQPQDRVAAGFDAAAFKGLPANTAWAVDAQRVLLSAAASALQIDFVDNFPLTIYLSRNGGILYSSEGYRIGVGESVVKVVKMEATANAK